ncbi:DnaJ domain containing protein [Trichomonas vaginalis G3]|uniref:DnaJ domain containing protein n=1 Tax=Trichomonas vaginalis (strain ATCC PRA-98 / G3) TaxID=412133 RepID=A2FGC0_TRIV3|nr:protein folding [Trichomonas vaginalis G3]EAX96066.1 DnaJ domain containing protein [Trichomonas vaginalis G3]KAI5504010.1 protein folding [Trichomonas vaginalis G3]|eukprot:XP_001308996.1 DnaJ domain containing protein [Trichomonas vaginalis G3]
MSEVQRILNCKSYYEVLQVKENFKKDELKQNYRKIAALVHPDKCQDPMATEAFQKVTNAYSTLNDDTKRKLYNQVNKQEQNDISQEDLQIYEYLIREYIKKIFKRRLNCTDIDSFQYLMSWLFADSDLNPKKTKSEKKKEEKLRAKLGEIYYRSWYEIATNAEKEEAESKKRIIIVIAIVLIIICFLITHL